MASGIGSAISTICAYQLFNHQWAEAERGSHDARGGTCKVQRSRCLIMAYHGATGAENNEEFRHTHTHTNALYTFAQARSEWVYSKPYLIKVR